MPLERPGDFWEVSPHILTPHGYSGLCCGFEQGNWREKQLIDYAMEWIPEFALNKEERESIKHNTSVAQIRKAAQTVYAADNCLSRGEFGELFLHAAIRVTFDSYPAASKIYYKSSLNDTVKGFDCVYIVKNDSSLELWLGEAKFYNDLERAVTDALASINSHMEIDYLRDEFLLIGNVLDDFPEKAEIKKLIDKKTSLDKIFSRTCIPVFLTYEGESVKQNTHRCQRYTDVFTKEIESGAATFYRRNKHISKVRFHLFLMPIANKERLVESLDKRLKLWQSL